MKKTAIASGDHSGQLSVSTSGLQSMLGCGRDTAIKIGRDSGARIQVGRRVLWNVQKIKTYLDSVSDMA